MPFQMLEIKAASLRPLSWREAREMLKQVVHNYPEYAYGWNKLAMVEYQSGAFDLTL